jgi:hypothetical protein
MKFIFAFIFVFSAATAALALPTFNPQLVLKNQQGETSVMSPQAGSNFVANFKSATVTLTAAQVIGAASTPIQILPAQTGKVLEVVASEMLYTKGASAFTINSSKSALLRYHTSNVQIGTISTTGFLDSSSSKTAFVYGPGAGGVGIGGQAVEFTTDDQGMGSGTGSTVKITVFYNVLNVL